MSAEYPESRLRFQADWAGSKISFSEISGLRQQIEVIEFRHDDDSGKNKSHGTSSHGNITIKRGVFEGGLDYADWLDQISNLRSSCRHDVIVCLLNEKQEPVSVWKVAGCILVKIVATVSESNVNLVSIESIEIAHEGFSRVR